MTRSLKGQMIQELLLWIVVAWSASLVEGYAFAASSQTSRWGERLQSAAIQVWDGHDRLIAGTPGAPISPLRPDFIAGLGSVSIAGEAWRVYSAADRTGRYHIQVGSPRATIDA